MATARTGLPPRNPELDQVICEDLAHLEQLWKSESLSNKDIRLSSQIVRRLLLDGDLGKVAASRGVKLSFVAPDNKPLMRCAENGYIAFFQSAGTEVFGFSFRAITTCLTARPHPDMQSAYEGWTPEGTLELRLDSFLRQPVFYFPATFDKKGAMTAIQKHPTWPQLRPREIVGTQISRRDVISYVANKAGGPHFDVDRPEVNACLDRIRCGVKYSLADNGVLELGFNPRAFGLPPDDLVSSPRSIDSVFLELAATCRYISLSPVVQNLRQQIEAELDRVRN